MNVEETANTAPTPGANLDLDKMPGHWLLARLGMRGVFNRYQQHLSAITLVARKPG